MRTLIPAVAVLAALPILAFDRDAPALEDSSAANMAAAATRLLAALSTEQRAKAALAFDSDQRTNWQFVPGIYPGVPGDSGASARAGRRSDFSGQSPRLRAF